MPALYILLMLAQVFFSGASGFFRAFLSEEVQRSLRNQVVAAELLRLQSLLGDQLPDPRRRHAQVGGRGFGRIELTHALPGE